MNSTESPRGAGSPWRALIATTTVQALVSMSALTPPVLAAVATEEVGLPGSFVGYYASLVYLGAMVTSLVSGGVIGRYGAMRVSQACLVLCAAGLGALAATQAGPLVVIAVVGALVIGLGYGPITPASSHILARTTPAERRGLVFSIKQTACPLAECLPVRWCRRWLTPWAGERRRWWSAPLHSPLPCWFSRRSPLLMLTAIRESAPTSPPFWLHLG